MARFALAFALAFALLTQGLGIRRVGGQGRSSGDPPDTTTSIDAPPDTTSSTEIVFSTERVHEVVTYGAARAATSEFRNPASEDGCFKGYRFVAKDTFSNDMVPQLMKVIWWHPAMETVYVDWKGRVTSEACGVDRVTLRFPSIHDHLSSGYMERLSNFTDAIDATVNGLSISYESNATIIEDTLQAAWVLVGTAVLSTRGSDIANLVQHRDTGNCMLTFSGSDDVADWTQTNAAVRPEAFCSLEGWYHNGFAAELMNMVQSDEYVANIKPRLSDCTKITVLGHSMGGALAALFAACANNEAVASADGQFMALKWW